ncbi:MAG: adenylate/guanylate cyclase with Chase sensor, partial [Solirubrobacteraceae bacterium]|nr:adenylate/guanylate cyclase with Chase sensor [Solirubrobacteraceae bacterium]
DARPPIPRRLHARMIDLLRRDGAKVIAYDFQFTQQTDAADDNALFRAVARAGNVVLGTTIVGAHGQQTILGKGGTRRAHALAGSTNLPTTSGSIRRFPHDDHGLPSFAVAAAQAALGRPVGRSRFPGGSAWIDFAGPPKTVTTVPFVSALRGHVPASAFRGKVVVVGAVDPILQDVHPTAFGEGMPGPEINANAIATVLAGLPLRDPPGWLAFLLIAAAGLAVPLAGLRLTGLRWLPVPLALALLYPVAAQLAFDGGTVLPVAAPALALLAGFLATLAIAYATDLRERRRLRAAFARFVPPQVVDEVVAQADGAPRLGGVQREATVLFCDLRGFTTVAEHLPAELVIAVLNRYLTEMSDAILDAGGTVVSYMGDGIMAVFGAPLASDDHADRALRAAREMLGPRLAAFNEWARQELAMGVGICTGPVMSGNVGSDRRLEYAAVGDTTNTASRLEALTKETGCAVLISDATRAALHGEARGLRSVGELELRGRSGRLTAWTFADDSGAGDLAGPARI